MGKQFFAFLVDRDLSWIRWYSNIFPCFLQACRQFKIGTVMTVVKEDAKWEQTTILTRNKNNVVVVPDTARETKKIFLVMCYLLSDDIFAPCSAFCSCL